MATTGIAILNGGRLLPSFIRNAAETPDCHQPDVDPEWWFPLRLYNTPRATQARAVCRACPLREECADWAADTGQQYGIWGGLDPAELKVRRTCRQGTAA